MNRRAVITGCGTISSIGNNCKEVLDSLMHNKSGIVAVPEWGKYGFRSRIAGTIKGIEIQDMREKIGRALRYMNYSPLYSMLAAMEAIADSGLTPEKLSSDKVGCIVGSGVSNTMPIYLAGAKLYAQNGEITPYGIVRAMCSSCSANLVNFFGIKGRSYSISSACATSLHCVGHACELIWGGQCDVVLAGGADEISAIMTANFDAMRMALSSAFNDTPEKASRPYDKRRDGFVISGGSGIVIVEEFEHAKKRNAPIYAEIIGYGTSSDGYDIIQPQPEGEGSYRCMKEALTMANCPVEEINYINTHGTGTVLGDIAEYMAIKKIFCDYQVPISSTKSLTGHGIAATGAQEVIYCALMMKHDFITASVNIEELDPIFSDCDIIKENRQTKLKKILTNSFGFGGTNACLILQSI